MLQKIRYSLAAQMFLAVWLVFSLTACATNTATPTITPGHNLLYALNFDTEAAFDGWHVGAPGQYAWLKNTKDGHYLFEYPSGFLESQDFDFADIQVALDVEFLVKTRVEVGLACRMQPGAGGRYSFAISNDGRWNIRKSNTNEMILAEGWSDQIKDDINRLAARCIGDRLTLLVNDVEIGSAHDGDFTSGSLNFEYSADSAGAGTFDNMMVEDWGSGQSSASQPQPDTGEIIYAEYFDQPEQMPGWDAKLDANSQANPQDGAYRLAGDSSMAAFIQREQTFSDALIEVDVKILGTAQVGILCRNESENYGFLLADNGAWVIAKGGKPLASGNVRLQPGFNHLAASCIGNQLGFALNGETLGSVTDDTLQQGQIGLTLETQGKAEALFDNLIVRRPAAQGAETAATQVAAVDPVTPTPLPAATNTPTLVPTPAATAWVKPVATLRPTLIPEDELTLYETEFDDNDPTLADWKTFAFSMDKKDFVTEGYKTWTANGVYLFEQQANTRVFAIYDKDLGVADVDISTRGGAPFEGHGGLGLVCRYSEAGWYQFMVEPRGGVWTIRLVKPDEDGQYHFHTIASGGKWLGQKMDLRAECKGDRLTFYIDGEKMASLHDSTFPTGKVGLLGWAFTIGDDWNTVDKFSARRAHWSETNLPGPAPTPGADGIIYNTDFVKLGDLDPYWAKTDWGVLGIPGSPHLIGGPGGQVAPHTYLTINDFDPAIDVEISADIYPVYLFRRGLICRYSEDGWYEAFYLDGGSQYEDSITLVRKQREEHGKFTGAGDTILGTYYFEAKGKANLTLTCAGNQFSVKMNGEPVLHAEDDTWTSGRYGLLFMDNPPGNLHSAFGTYTVRPAQTFKTGDVTFDTIFDTPEKIALAFQINLEDKRVSISNQVLQLAPDSTSLHLVSVVNFINSEMSLSVELQAKSDLILHCRAGSPGETTAELRGNGDWSLWSMGQALGMGNNPSAVRVGKNQFVLACLDDQVTLNANDETLAVFPLPENEPASGTNNVDVLEFGDPVLVSEIRLKSFYKASAPQESPLLNQVILPPVYQPGETIFAWNMHNFITGCRSGWWGRDTNPCLWNRFYRQEDWERSRQGETVWVKGYDKNLTLFTYQPDLYDLPIEISAKATLTSKGGGMALFCRATANGRYEFYIQPDGKWFIRRNVVTEYYLPKTRHLTILTQGTVENFSPENMQLNAICNSPDLIFTLNGVELGRAQDTLYPEGQAGIFFDAFSEGSFTNLFIKRTK